MNYKGIIKEHNGYKIEYREVDDILVDIYRTKINNFCIAGYVLSFFGTMLLTDMPKWISMGLWCALSVAVGFFLVFSDILMTQKRGLKIRVTGNGVKEDVGSVAYSESLSDDSASLKKLVNKAEEKISELQIAQEKYNSYREQLLHS
jgi:hypothetical protein